MPLEMMSWPSHVLNGSLENVLSANEKRGNIAFKDCLAGFTKVLQASNLTSANLQIKELVVDGADEMSTPLKPLQEELSGRLYISSGPIVRHSNGPGGCCSFDRMHSSFGCI
jgi:hypothetical protein